jgi:hypothetical protein
MHDPFQLQMHQPSRTQVRVLGWLHTQAGEQTSAAVSWRQTS